MNLEKSLPIVFLLKAFAFILRLLPFTLVQGLARLFGSIGYALAFKRRKLVYANLRTFLAGHKTDAQIRALTRRVFMSFALNVVEFLNFPKFKAQGFTKFVNLHGRENVEAAKQKGKGFIILAIHAGNWELASIVGSEWGVPYSITVNKQNKFGAVGDLLNSYRQVAGASVITVGEGTKGILRALKGNEMISLVLDQGGKEGVQVDFLGKKTSMSTGAIRLAMKYELPLLPAWIVRRKDGRHDFYIKPPLTLVNTGDLEKDVLTNTQMASAYYERLLLDHPDEYMWFYKVYKYSSQSNIVILDDGRVGHLRQSQAVARSLQVQLRAKGKKYKEDIIRIDFKNEVLAKLFVIFSSIAQFMPFLLSERWLRFFLKDASFNALLAVKADYVISTGSLLPGVNLCIARDHLAKSYHVLKTGLLGAWNFDFIALPQHDAKDKNGHQRLFISKVALNLINSSYLAGQGVLLEKRFSHLKGKVRTKFALLLGGDTKGVVFDEGQLRLLVKNLKEAAVHYNADILVTTSRRTSAAIEQIVAKELKNFERCPLCIIANENNVPEAMGGILSLADLVIVSSESISMVSEALSSGKKVITFDPRGSYTDRPVDKYQRFVFALNDEGYLLISSVKDIPAKVAQLLTHKITLKALDDQARLEKAIEAVL